MYLQEQNFIFIKQKQKMEKLQRIEEAILEVKNNPKYRKNRKYLINFLENKLLKEILVEKTKEKILKFHERLLVNREEKNYISG